MRGMHPLTMLCEIEKDVGRKEKQMRGQLMKEQMKTTRIIFFKGHNYKRRIK